MEVTDQMVEKLANLSRLWFNEQEKQAIKGDLQKMIAFIEQLQSVDTTGTEPLLHLTEAMNAYREDVVQGSMDKKEALQNAPAANEDYFLVPKVIKK